MLLGPDVVFERQTGVSRDTTRLRPISRFGQAQTDDLWSAPQPVDGGWIGGKGTINVRDRTVDANVGIVNGTASVVNGTVDVLKSPLDVRNGTLDAVPLPARPPVRTEELLIERISA